MRLANARSNSGPFSVESSSFAAEGAGVRSGVRQPHVDGAQAGDLDGTGLAPGLQGPGRLQPDRYAASPAAEARGDGRPAQGAGGNGQDAGESVTAANVRSHAELPTRFACALVRPRSAFVLLR